MAAAQDTGRALDLVLLGATGFTGRLVAAELDRRIAGTRLRWGVAGRDREALERVAAPLASAPTRIHADVTDPRSLAALAVRTRVLATTVGPYVRLGRDVARACAEHGTHYADISGEEEHVRVLERDVDPLARRTGATLVVCCGFDSVPHDLGVQFAVEALPDGADVEVRGYVRARGRPSGGTARTALDAFAAGVAAAGPAPVAPDGGRSVGRLTLGLHRPERLGGWGVPLPTVDPLIVLRSARALPGYGHRFRYGHFAHVRHATTLAAGGVALAAGALAARTAPGRRLLERWLPDPGDGPDAATRAAGRFTVLLMGAALPDDGSAPQHVVARVRGRDPGYGETSRMLAEAALTLVGDERPDVTGVVTPAIGLGVPYRRRLEAAGIRFELVEQRS